MSNAVGNEVRDSTIGNPSTYKLQVFNCVIWIQTVHTFIAKKTLTWCEIHVEILQDCEGRVSRCWEEVAVVEWCPYLHGASRRHGSSGGCCCYRYLYHSIHSTSFQAACLPAGRLSTCNPHWLLHQLISLPTWAARCVCYQETCPQTSPHIRSHQVLVSWKIYTFHLQLATLIYV